MKNRSISKYLLALCLPVAFVACDGDDEASLSTDFATISSNYYEADGSGSVIIPLRNVGSASALDVTFGGTATEGEDFELVGITSEGVEINVINDNLLEDTETVRIQLTSSGGSLNGNTIHELNIVSDCADLVGLELSAFAGVYDAIEKYGDAPADWYGPYSLTITQDATNPNRFNMTDFYDSNRAAHFIVDIAAGTVYFPNQTPLPDGTPNQITNSSGTFSLCEVEGHLTLTINLNYDGGDWVYYFEKH